MNQAKLNYLVSKLAIRVAPKHRQFNNPEGLYGRLKKMRKTVTALVRHERIELFYPRADEARGYAERLISEAVRYGDCHKPTMDHAKFWVEDPALVPKLFKVLAARYQNWPPGIPYTRLLRAPSNPADLKEFDPQPRAVLELRGNPYPPLPGPVTKKHPGAIHNVLLEEARKEYHRNQSAIAKKAETLSSVLPESETCGLDPVQPGEIEENVAAATGQTTESAPKP